MPSSTFSSEPRAIPDGNWRATWAIAIAIAIAMTWWCERLTRARGQRPSVVDDPVWWSLSRRTVDDDPRVVAFVGTSRLALGYSARAFAEAAPELRGVQLAIDGVPAFGVLEDLANDEHFRGVAVADVIEWDVGVFDAFTGARPYVQRAHALWRAPGALVNRFLAALVQEHLAVLAVGGRPIVTSLIGKRRWPPPLWVVSDRDRISYSDYSLAEPAALQKKKDARLVDFFAAIPSPEAWLAALDRDFEPMVQRIRAHGGDVVIVRMPVTGQLAAAFDKGYPRARYWDAFAARSAAHVIDVRDIPALAKLVCPDEMHLDQRDQAAFTRGLVEALRARGYIK